MLPTVWPIDCAVEPYPIFSLLSSVITHPSTAISFHNNIKLPWNNAIKSLGEPCKESTRNQLRPKMRYRHYASLPNFQCYNPRKSSLFRTEKWILYETTHQNKAEFTMYWIGTRYVFRFPNLFEKYLAQLLIDQQAWITASMIGAKNILIEKGSKVNESALSSAKCAPFSDNITPKALPKKPIGIPLQLFLQSTDESYLKKVKYEQKSYPEFVISRNSFALGCSDWEWVSLAFVL